MGGQNRVRLDLDECGDGRRRALGGDGEPERRKPFGERALDDAVRGRFGRSEAPVERSWSEPIGCPNLISPNRSPTLRPASPLRRPAPHAVPLCILATARLLSPAARSRAPPAAFSPWNAFRRAFPP